MNKKEQELKEKRDSLILKIEWRLKFLEFHRSQIREHYKHLGELEHELREMTGEIKELEYQIDHHGDQS